ncbi:MAG TPA: D-arabinono-1,4-lactone oxidase [Bacillota bacterium]|nr:D-arabinono-1,4-lactone oxidase [Bacillota bacterium]
MFSMKRDVWQNWSQTVYCHPEKIHYPKNIDDVIQLVTACRRLGKSMRIVGAGHSFTPLAATSEWLVSLKYLSGIAAIDRAKQSVTVWAGTTLKDLGQLLYDEGYAMENFGDINAQSVAGAISTGTHGTGIGFGSLSTQVTMLTIVTASGEIMDISAKNTPQLFDAARLSLGMFGIIVKVELSVIPTQKLVAESYRTTLEHCFNNLDMLLDTNRHFEFYWFPYTETVQVKILNNAGHNTVKSTGKRAAFKKYVIENGLFWILSEITRTLPAISKRTSQISAMSVPTGIESGESHLLYPTPRLVKFREMEYSVPAAYLPAVLNDIRYTIEKENIRVHFPIECRYVQADNIWLSPSYNRDSAYIAIHMYKGMTFQTYFDAVEKVFQHYNGRPHWGKMHTMTAEQLENLYPHFQTFLHLRQEMDPNGIFLNPYVKHLFNIP